MCVLLIALLVVIFFAKVILPDLEALEGEDDHAKTCCLDETHLIEERHHVATDYHDTLLNTKEGFLRICSRHGIKVKRVRLSKDGKVEQIVLKQWFRKPEQVSVLMPYTEEKYNLLSGFVMKSFSISPKTMTEDGECVATSLFGFGLPEYVETIKWCHANDVSAIRKALILD